jgi:hypothetical protein
MGLSWGRSRFGLLIKPAWDLFAADARSHSVIVGATVSALQAVTHSSIRRIGDLRQRNRGILMTIRHQTWLADVVAGSVLLVALYLVLLEFSTARLP